MCECVFADKTSSFSPGLKLTKEQSSGLSVHGIVERKPMKLFSSRIKWIWHRPTEGFYFPASQGHCDAEVGIILGLRFRSALGLAEWNHWSLNARMLIYTARQREVKPITPRHWVLYYSRRWRLFWKTDWATVEVIVPQLCVSGREVVIKAQRFSQDYVTFCCGLTDQKDIFDPAEGHKKFCWVIKSKFIIANATTKKSTFELNTNTFFYIIAKLVITIQDQGHAVENLEHNS